ncbi:uncharacterized protein EAE98_001480 [Botrytis deweyae]|uniref:Uncharacterized protein n=1 Tax=Botrytis deweyae TaxID=2478750 RepID=A0ABQ7IY80_9HELO|nr:uncharacterized protein EAE98_001480 [Botrytis deweyae]KAF7937166.1 hypothetical protein EAE98_001480 [Botrytis deweyae]
MAKYISRQPEMLNRLYEEGRSNKEYRTEFDEVRYERAIARLPQQERLEAIERIVYKRLFGETSTDKEDDAKNAKSAAEPKKEEASESNDGRTSEKSVVAGISYRDQAAKTPPPEESKLTERQKWVNARHEAYKARYNPIAWHRMEENYKKNLPIITKRDAILDKRYIELLPMRPGGKIHQFSIYAPPTWNCKNYWSVENNVQIKKPELVDWDIFEKDSVKGLELFIRYKKFVEFWIWIFIGIGYVTDRVLLIICLE